MTIPQPTNASPTPTTSLPPTMNAVVNHRGGAITNGASFTDEQLPTPALAQGHDLLVKVEAVSVNPVDTKLRAAHRTGSGRVLGFDAAGTVVSVGEATRLFRPGDRVFYAGDITRPGSDAAFQLVDERIVGHAPTSLSSADAAALPLTSLTAWEALFDKLRIADTDTGTLLVVGAAGGVGSMVIQLAKTLTRLTVIALASNPASGDWARALGADHVLDYRDPQCAERITELAGHGVDYVFSAYSKGNIPLYAKVMRPFGQVVAIDDERDLDWYALKDKGLSWHWEFMFARAKHHAPDVIRQHEILERIAALVDAGDLRTTVTRRLAPLNASTLREAHSMVETHHMLGKVVIAAR